MAPRVNPMNHTNEEDLASYYYIGTVKHCRICQFYRDSTCNFLCISKCSNLSNLFKVEFVTGSDIYAARHIALADRLFG